MIETDVLIIQTFLFGFAFWLGAYLLGRNPARPLLRYTGLGLMSYGLAMAFDLLLPLASSDQLALRLKQLYLLFIFTPILFWIGSIIHLIPAELPVHHVLARFWRWGLAPVMLLLYLVAVFIRGEEEIGTSSLLFWLFSLALGAALLTLFFFMRYLSQSERPSLPLGLIAVTTLFFTLGMGMFLLPFQLVPRLLLLLAIGLDLELLGVAIVILDSFDEGETFLPDLLRSFHFTLFAVLLFAGPVALLMVLSSGLTLSLLSLFFALVAVAILRQTFADQIESGLDRIAFVNLAPQRETRQELRAALSAVPKVKTGLDFEELDKKEFTRLTRRALKYYGDLPRLAANPLTRLSLIDRRLAERGSQDSTLERAAELKAILKESIHKLKPRHKGDFGTSKEWRYYNALYFPYVVGLKPYSRRDRGEPPDEVAEEALQWFQAEVPARTLYNWQSAAAKLVAQHIREQLQQQAVHHDKLGN